MKFPEPKELDTVRVTFNLPKRIVKLLDFYADYSKLSKDEIVAFFLRWMANDPKFNNWVDKKRNNKKIKKELFELENNEISADFDDICATLEELGDEELEV